MHHPLEERWGGTWMGESCHSNDKTNHDNNNNNRGDPLSEANELWPLVQQKEFEQTSRIETKNGIGQTTKGNTVQQR